MRIDAWTHTISLSWRAANAKEGPGDLVLSNMLIDHLSTSLTIYLRLPPSQNPAGPSTTSSCIPEPDLLLIRQVIETVQNIHITLLLQ